MVNREISRNSSNISDSLQDAVALNGPEFYGTLIKGVVLNKIAREKAEYYDEITVPIELKERYLSEGWYQDKQVRNNIILRKDKKSDELLENEIWILFKRLNFLEMNKDRNFKIQVDTATKQIDIFAKDDNNVFIIFCTTNASIPIKNEIRNLSDLKRGISLSVKKYYKKDFRISVLLVTRNLIWSESDEKLAQEKQIIIWKDEDIDAYKTLINQLGYAAKYQIFSILFSRKKASEVGNICVPAMRGGKGKGKYYLFLIHPEDLFKIAYVHRREKSNPEEISRTYQRMVDKHRIEEIGKYIDECGKSFPNNVIIAFKYKPHFELNAKVPETSEISYGLLKFPPFYGNAWIIDGQHRIYGYSKSNHASDHTIPVIAFESLGINEQANLFVDINEKQMAVSKALLWDLYPDIYEESSDEYQQKLRAISLIAKKLNSNKNSIFFDRIQIPSVIINDKSKSNLTLTNLCEGIKENRLIDKSESLLFNQDYQESINKSAEIINTYFGIIYAHLKGDWDNGDSGLVRTNVGMRILFMILKQLLREIYRRGKNNLYKKRDLTEFKQEAQEILNPILFKLKNMESQEKNDIRFGSSKGQILRNTQKLLWRLKEETGFGLELWNNKKSWNPGVPNDEDENHIIKLIDDTEKKLREIIIKRLKERYNNNWFKQALPNTVKDAIARVIDQETKKFPYKRETLNKLTDEEKLKYSLTSNLKEIIINDANWDLFDEEFYKYKNCVEVIFGFFENFRNKYKHPDRALNLEENEKGLGYYGMGWIRKCIGLNPKKV